MRKDTSKRSPQQGLQLLQKTFYPKMLSSISQKYYVLIETLKSYYLIEIFFFLILCLREVVVQPNMHLWVKENPE